jgi:tubulin-specific chaperone D
LSGIIKSGSPNDVLPFLINIFDFALKAATAESVDFAMMRASAPARKMLVAILRTSTLHALSLNSRHDFKAISEDTLCGMLEGIIQYLLDALGDKDTPVRLSASKALSMLAQKLDKAMKGEVVQAVLDALESDVLYEKPDSGDPIPGTLLTNTDMQTMSRNMTAVNPLKWQGLLLTLSHMLFRRTAPPDQLSPILKSLLSGLDFEQRSAGGTSIGGSVRDAACFGLWSLSRKYATSEASCQH